MFLKLYNMEHVHEIKINKLGHDEPFIAWSDEVIGALSKYEEYFNDASSFEVNVHIRSKEDIDDLYVVLALLDRYIND